MLREALIRKAMFCYKREEGGLKIYITGSALDGGLGDYVLFAGTSLNCYGNIAPCPRPPGLSDSADSRAPWPDCEEC